MDRGQEVEEIGDAKHSATKASKAWQFLNSSFGLWLLSSVFLSGLTTAYSIYQTKQAAEAHRMELVRKLDTEIGNRIFQALATLKVNRTRVAQGESYKPVQLYLQVAYFLDNEYYKLKEHDFSVFPEYRERNFISLLSELSSVVSSSERDELREVLKVSNEIADKTAILPKGEAAIDPIRSVDEVIELVEQRLQKPRWKMLLAAQ